MLPTIEEEYRLGLGYLASGSPWLLASAAMSFDHVLKWNSKHLEAMIGLVESRCRLAFLLAHKWAPENYVMKTLKRSEEFLSDYPADARVCLMHAAASLTACQMHPAARSFKSALARDRALTEKSLWYAAFLLRIGRRDEALARVRMIAADSRFDVLRTACCAALYYVAGELTLFSDALVWGRDLDVNCWLIKLLMCIHNLESKEYRQAMLCYDAVEEIAISWQKQIAFPGLMLLCVVRLAQSETLTEEERAERLARISQLDRIPPPRIDQVQSLISDMAVGKIEEAARRFTLAVEEGDPLVLWIPLMSLFNPLKDSALYHQCCQIIEGEMQNARRIFES